MAGFPGLIPIPLQTLPEFIICDIDQKLQPHYIDVAESFGLAADVCSRCSAETGVAIDDDFPIFGKAMLSTNMPCNASEATSMFQRRRIALPDFPVTLAMIHNEPGAHPYSKQVLKDAIAFIEKEYGVPQRFAPDISKEMINQNGLYRTLEKHGVLVNSARETFRAINVNKEQSKLLNVRIDAAAIALTRTAYSGPTVVEYCVSVVRGDFFSYSVELT